MSQVDPKLTEEFITYILQKLLNLVYYGFCWTCRCICRIQST